MIEKSPRKLRSGKFMQRSYTKKTYKKTHLILDNSQNSISNSESVSNPSDTTLNNQSLISQTEVNQQVSQLQNEMSEIKT